MRSIYLDACAIIEAVEKPSQEGEAIVGLIAGASGDDTRFVTSELSLLEAMVIPARASEQDDVIRRSHQDWYRSNLTPDGALIRTIPVTREILIGAASIRSRVSSIRTPDALHVATAQVCDCKYFVTGDDDLRRRAERDQSRAIAGRRLEFVKLSLPTLAEFKDRLLRG